MAGPRKTRGLVSRRRRVDEEGEEGPEIDDDSMTEGTITDDEDVDNGSTTGTDSPVLEKAAVNGKTKTVQVGMLNDTNGANKSTISGDTDLMMQGLKIGDADVESVDYNDVGKTSPQKPTAKQPVIVKSAYMDQLENDTVQRRRREHDEYRKKRDEDPAFVPNRGAFFMHDHRHAGPAANGFRPFGKARRGGRGGIGGPFAPMSWAQQMSEVTDAPWAHDMHEATLVDRRASSRGPPYPYNNGNYARPHPVPQAAPGQLPNRSMSTTKLVGNVQIKVYLPGMEKTKTVPSIPLNQYTRLPDHRPPLRRDKPVRISLPDNPPRYIFPAQERSFIFIPRALRPNQQGFGSRTSRPRQNLGSIGGFSRRTSIYGGSMYGGSYTPSIAMSRRSSLAYETHRDMSPMGPGIARQSISIEAPKPIVRLPPSMVPAQQPAYGQMPPPQPPNVAEAIPQPPQQTQPPNPQFRENRPNSVQMQHPRPQKTVSVDNIESPAVLSYNPPQQYPQPFSNQLPPQVSNYGYGPESQMPPHSRTQSYQGSTGTPLSQIPERAIHAQPFHPNAYQPQGYYGQQYPMQPQQQGLYYPPQYASGVSAPPVQYAGSQPPMGSPYTQSEQAPADGAAPSNLVVQEINGMFYYYDATQIPAVATFPAAGYPPPQGYQPQQSQHVPPGVALQHGMMTPSPDGFYYAQPQQGMVYYP